VTIDELDELFRQGYQWLAATSDRAWLCRKDAVFAVHGEALTIMDAARALEGLRRLVSPTRWFSLRELAQTVGIDYWRAYDWTRKGLIRPGKPIRHGVKTPFGFHAVFVAGTLAALHRRGVRLAALRRVASFLNGPVPTVPCSEPATVEARV
jgi:hypothetical protein